MGVGLGGLTGVVSPRVGWGVSPRVSQWVLDFDVTDVVSPRVGGWVIHRVG